MTVYSARKRLAILWVLFFMVEFVFLLIQSVGWLEGQFAPVFKWYLPHIIPTMTLILGIFSATQKNPKGGSQSASSFLFRLCFIFSLFYLLLLTCLCISGPFVVKEGNGSLYFLKESNVWLIPLQSLVGICMGWFFWNSKNKVYT